MTDPMPAVKWILGMPVGPKSPAEQRDETDRQMISDAQNMAADIVDIDRHVAGVITDLASALERRMEP